MLFKSIRSPVIVACLAKLHTPQVPTIRNSCKSHWLFVMENKRMRYLLFSGFQTSFSLFYSDFDILCIWTDHSVFFSHWQYIYSCNIFYWWWLDFESSDLFKKIIPLKTYGKDNKYENHLHSEELETNKILRHFLMNK